MNSSPLADLVKSPASLTNKSILLEMLRSWLHLRTNFENLSWPGKPAGKKQPDSTADSAHNCKESRRHSKSRLHSIYAADQEASRSQRPAQPGQHRPTPLPVVPWSQNNSSSFKLGNRIRWPFLQRHPGFFTPAFPQRIKMDCPGSPLRNQNASRKDPGNPSAKDRKLS